MALKNNTWKLNQWYDQDVAGNVEYSGLKSLWVWGQNANGGLGQNQGPGQLAAVSSPVQIPGTTWSIDSFFPSTSTGATSIIPKTDGTLWSWGKNEHGECGQNIRTAPSNNGLSSPAQIGSDTDWSKSGTLSTQGWAIKTDGTLWMMGANGAGQLGQNDTNRRSSPTQIPGTTWSKCYGAQSATLGKKTDGTLWSWGYNSHGQLGLNNRTNYSSPIQIPGSWSVVDGGGCMGGIKTDGTLWCWGLNEKGQLGQNAGGDNAMRSSPVQVGSDTTWSKLSMVHKGLGAIKTDGTLWVLGGLGVGGWGLSLPDSFDGYSSPIQIPGTTWDTLSFSYRGHFATKTDGTRWGWGNNDFGSLGLNNTAQYSSPVQLPGFDPTDWLSVQGYGSTGKSTIATKQL